MKTNNKVAMMIVGIPIITTILSATILSSTYVSADNDSVVDEINITVPVSCTLSGTGMDSHSTEIQNGLYKDNIGTTTLHAFCNDNEGFAIYAAGYTGNEIGGTNSNKLVGTNASSNATIVSGIATTAGSPDISNWAMKLAISQDSGDTTSTNAFTIDSAPNVDLPSTAEQSATPASFSEYHVVPNEYVKVAHKNSMTDMTESTGGVKLTTTYAAYVSKTQPADTYTGQVIYTLVHPASAVPKVPVSCNPTGTTIGTNTSTDIKCMQDITSTNKSSVLASMINETQYTLIDKRDEKSYTIAKLADGNIWMTQNLDHDIVTDGSVIYDNTTTDLGWNSSTNSYDIAHWVPDTNTATSTASFTSNNQIVLESYDPGELYWNGDITPSTQIDCEIAGGVWNDYGSWGMCDIDLTSSTGDSHYHLGNYYNRTAAMAMNDSSGYQSTGIVNQSICPSGWTLPRSGLGEDSFYSLWIKYGHASGYDEISFDDISSIVGSPAYFVLAGAVDSANPGVAGVGNRGTYISSVTDNNGYAFGQKEGSIWADNEVTGIGYPDSMDGSGNGVTIRCIARPISDEIENP